jgi:hypothetical protein
MKYSGYVVVLKNDERFEINRELGDREASDLLDDFVENGVKIVHEDKSMEWFPANQIQSIYFERNEEE